MLSDQQVDHFRTFGFVVLRRYLGDQETAALGDEMDPAHRDAFGTRFDERPDEGGMPGHYLPMMSRQRTPVSLGLVEDPRFLGAAGQLVEAAVLPTYAEGILLFDQAGFHDDAGPGVKAVKFVAYLEPLTAATGALRLLPGSHVPEFSASLVGWRQHNRADDAEQLRRQVDGLPLYVAETRPGDVIAFEWHTGIPASAAGTATSGRSATSGNRPPPRKPNGSRTSCSTAAWPCSMTSLATIGRPTRFMTSTGWPRRQPRLSG